MSSKVKPPQTVDGDKYKTEKKLGAGCFGEVWRGIRVEDKLEVAIKFEVRTDKTAPQLEHESEVLTFLRNNDKGDPSKQVADPQGIAMNHFYGLAGNSHNCLVMEMLGKSLEDRVQQCKGKLQSKSAILIAVQLLQRIEFLHSKGLVHRDIKPENFMFGINDKIHHVYIIDFGLSKKYWDKARGHNPPKQKMSLTGTARYASINAHKGFEQSRRDDLEAIGHMFLYFLRGALPWSGLEAKTQEEKYRKIVEKKEQVPLPELCQGHPKEFLNWLQYARGMEYTEKPDYTKLWSSMNDLRANWKDHEFEWFDAGKDPAPERLTPLYERKLFQQPDDQKGPEKKQGCCVIA